MTSFDPLPLWLSLVDNLLVATVLTGGILLAARWFRLHPGLRHALWLLVLLKLCTPPLLSAPALLGMPAPAVVATPPAVTDDARSARAPTASPAPWRQAPPAAPATGPNSGGATPPAPAAVPSSTATPSLRVRAWTTWLTAAWAIGAGIASLRLALAARTTRRRIAAGRDREVPAWLLERSDRIAARLGVRSPRIVVVDGLAAPCVGGIWAPRLLWPAAQPSPFAGIDAVLAHELAHVARRDAWTDAVVAAIGVVHWWNPLFHFARGRLEECAEEACDRRALEHGELDGRRFAELLLAFRGAGPVPARVCSAVRGHHAGFGRRLVALVRPRDAAGGPLGAAVVAAAAVLVTPSWVALDPDADVAPPERTAQDPVTGPGREDPRRIGTLAEHRPLEHRWVVAIDPGVDPHLIGDLLCVDDADAVLRVTAVAGRKVEALLVGPPTAQPRRGAAVTTAFRLGDRIGSLTVATLAADAVGLVWAERRAEALNLAGVDVFVAIDPRTALRMPPDAIDRDAAFQLPRPASVGTDLTEGATLPVYAMPRTDASHRVSLDAGTALGQTLRTPGSGHGEILVADYSDNRILHYGADGAAIRSTDDVYGCWDVEPLPGGGQLVTEFALGRVVEFDAAGEKVWSFDALRNPYDADRLPNGNTLIADTFGRRVIEVHPDGTIVWQLDGVKPYDVERLANGNTLIADVDHDRVLEVEPAKRIVWQLDGIVGAHDVDRLPNGHTLITIRRNHRVIEVDRLGLVHATWTGLTSPSDADLLDDGSILVAENAGVRVLSRDGRTLRTLKAAWAVEANAR